MLVAVNKLKTWINTIGALVLGLPFSGFCFWVSIEFVTNAWGIFESSPEPGGLPLVYLLKSLLLVLPATLFLQLLAQLIDDGIKLCLLENFAFDNASINASKQGQIKDD